MASGPDGGLAVALIHHRPEITELLVADPRSVSEPGSWLSVEEQIDGNLATMSWVSPNRLQARSRRGVHDIHLFSDD